MPLILPNTIDPDTTADAVELEQNNGVIEQYINTNLINRDGSVAMTNPLLLAGDPTQPNQAANKGYVDTKLALAGGTVTGQIKGIVPVAAEDLTRKDYVDAITDSAGRGIVAYAQAVVDQGGFTSAGGGADLIGCSVTFTAISGRSYKATAQCLPVASVSSSAVVLYLSTGVVTLQTTNGIQDGAGPSLCLSYVTSSISGSTFWKLHLRNFGGGTVTNGAGPTVPTFILVEDIGVL